jgi:hypothetical protein
MVLVQEQNVRPFVPAKVFLSADLRILPEPLRRGCLPGFDRLPIAFAGMARIFPFVAGASVDRQHLYEFVRTSSAGYPARTPGNRKQRNAGHRAGREESRRIVGSREFLPQLARRSTRLGVCSPSEAPFYTKVPTSRATKLASKNPTPAKILANQRHQKGRKRTWEL